MKGFMKITIYLVLLFFITAFALVLKKSFRIKEGDKLNRSFPTIQRVANTSDKSFIIEEELLRSERGFELWQIRYWSRNSAGQSVPTTAKVVKPAGNSRRYPAIIWNHGGPALTCATPKKLFNYAKLGYVVIGPDYQSCKNIDEHFVWFTSQINDVIGALDWLKAHPEFVDTNRIFMIGHSNGGAITVKTLDRLAELGRARDIQAASVDGGVYSYEAMLKSEGITESRAERGDPTSPALIYMRRYHISKEELQARYQASLPDVPANHDDIVTPIFIAHGSEDYTVHPDNARQLAADLAKLGVKYRLKFYPGAGHNLDASPRWNEYIRDLQTWFQENS